MPLKTPFIFSLDLKTPAVDSESALWSAPLPASRHAFGGSPRGNDFDDRVTYGDYFCAARDFLAKNDLALVCSAAGRLIHRPVNVDDITRIGVFLVKHGAFYHPSYIKVEACGRTCSLVLNVAVSSSGQEVIRAEFENLKRLNQELNSDYWPQVFGNGWGRTQAGRNLPMFLGQWLEGFHEFHLAAIADSDHSQTVVWNAGQGNPELTRGQVQDLMGQAARILGYAYNPITFEAIQSWHHAAGDFVVRQDETGIEVRLITVRKYAPLIAAPQPDVSELLETLLVYLVDISLRLRVDRLEGTRQMACHPVQIVASVCRGFLQGLQSAVALRGLPDDFTLTVKRFFALHGPHELMPIVDAAAKRIAHQNGERRLFESAMEAHAAELADALAAM